MVIYSSSPTMSIFEYFLLYACGFLFFLVPGSGVDILMSTLFLVFATFCVMTDSQVVYAGHNHPVPVLIDALK